MLTPDDIRKQAIKRYPKVIDLHFRGEPIFPIEFRFGRVSAQEGLIAINREVQLLLSAAEGPGRSGYKVSMQARKFRDLSEQTVPNRVWFDDLTSYLGFIGKIREFLQLEKDIAAFGETACADGIGEWAKRNAKTLLQRLSPEQGRALGLAVSALHTNPMPECFAREIPLAEVSGKFIEVNIHLIARILREVGSPAFDKDRGISPHEKLGLLTPNRLVRYRILAVGELDSGLALDTFLRPQSVDRVFIVENLRSYLTFPDLKCALAIYGEGRAAETLSGVGWLQKVELHYWGDMDPHGYSILSNLRKAFPHCQSFMMDQRAWDTYATRPDFRYTCAKIGNPDYSELSDSEQMGALESNSCGYGVEQEQIPLISVRSMLDAE